MLLQVLFSALLLLQAAAPSSVTRREDAGPPLREQELLSLVRSRGLFTEAQLLEMIASRGIGFRLTDATRRALKKDGASAALMAAVEKAAEALKRRSTAEDAAAAAAAVPPPVPPPPDLAPAAQKRLLEEVRQNALEYTDKLPNFICVQVVRRSEDFTGKGSWQLHDVIQTRLTYNEKKESYQVVSINDQLTNRPPESDYTSIGGTTSTGEFGSMLYGLFRRETEARFDWVGPAAVRGRPAYEFQYRVAQERSRWNVMWNKSGIFVAYRGSIVVDAETQQVLRLVMIAEEIPFSFPVREISTDLDYDFVTISGRRFLLPSRAVIESRTGIRGTRNEILFRQYRRFTADAQITFDEAPPNRPPQ